MIRYIASYHGMHSIRCTACQSTTARNSFSVTNCEISLKLSLSTFSIWKKAHSLLKIQHLNLSDNLTSACSKQCYQSYLYKHVRIFLMRRAFVNRSRARARARAHFRFAQQRKNELRNIEDQSNAHGTPRIIYLRKRHSRKLYTKCRQQKQNFLLKLLITIRLLVRHVESAYFLFYPRRGSSG